MINMDIYEAFEKLDGFFDALANYGKYSNAGNSYHPYRYSDYSLGFISFC